MERGSLVKCDAGGVDGGATSLEAVQFFSA